MSDTVGFIRNLPTTLVRAFRATLEEVVEAELLLHVVDASSPDAAQHTAHVMATLSEIGAAETPQILVLNKVDQIPGEPDAAVDRAADFAGSGTSTGGSSGDFGGDGRGIRGAAREDRRDAAARSGFRRASFVSQSAKAGRCTCCTSMRR